MRGRKPRPFWEQVQRCAHGDTCQRCCWEWQGARNSFGYGVCIRVIDGQMYSRTHRIAWVLTHKQHVPPERLICHHCDNRPCCNPHHLYSGTARDNGKDVYWKNNFESLRRRITTATSALHEHLSTDNLTPWRYECIMECAKDIKAVADEYADIHPIRRVASERTLCPTEARMQRQVEAIDRIIHQTTEGGQYAA